MHSLRIQTTHGDPLNFQFKSREAAQAAYDKLLVAWTEHLEIYIGVADDYNRQARLWRGSLVSMILSDLSQEVDCSVDLAILQAEAQTKANNRAQANPLLRAGGLIGQPHPRRQ